MTIDFLYSSLKINLDIFCKLQLGWHPVTVVQYTFTNKQYIEKHSETEYTEQNVHNNKNT
jgi:hypothetical protein